MTAGLPATAMADVERLIATFDAARCVEHRPRLT